MKIERIDKNNQSEVTLELSKPVEAPYETCPISTQSTCPISDPGSYPECGRVDTGPGVTLLCAGESPWIGGGSFVFSQTMGGTITSIETNDNRKGYCSDPTGVGSDEFSVYCACGGGCLISGEWTVYWDASELF